MKFLWWEQNCVYQDCDGKDLKAWHLYAKDEEKVSCLFENFAKKGFSCEEIASAELWWMPAYRGSGLARNMMERAIAFVEDELG